MDTRHVLLLTVLGFFSTGCGTNPCVRYEFDLLTSEIRELEDHVNELEHELEVKSEQLDDLNISSTPDTSKETELHPPNYQPDDNINPPEIDLEPKFENRGDADLKIDIPAFPADDVPPAPLEDSTASFSDVSIETQSSDTVDPYVTHVVLNRRLTSGFDGDGEPGDEGFIVVLEPRNANGQYVPLAGAVSVVAIDLELDGPESRLGHWNFTANETSQNLRTTLLAKGIHLQIPWTTTPPEHSRLRVFVRYKTVDGRQLEADEQVLIVVPGELSNRWTPTSRLSRRPKRPIINDNELENDAVARLIHDRQL